MMITSSIRKFGFAGVASLLLISGLAASPISAQAAGDTPGSMTLLQSPAMGSLSSLGGVTGYVDAQSDGDTNAWLSGQGIDPSAAGSITDTTIPDQAQGKITVANNTVSLASDATGVNVGYLVGDAAGTDTITASLSNIAVAAGHEDDNFVMNQAEYLAWLNGSTWQGHYTLQDYADFDFTITWSPDGAVATTQDTNPTDAAFLAQVQSTVNQGTQTPANLPLADVLANNVPYSWNQSFDVPYSFGYAVDGALTPGGSVSVNLNDVVSGSSLNDFNVSGAQTSGALSTLPLTSWLSPEELQLISNLPDFPAMDDTMTTADLTSAIMADIIDQGDIDSMVSSFVVAEVNAIIDKVNTGGSGYVLQPLDDAAQAQISDNTPTVLAMFLNDGFSDQLAQAMSATVNVNAALDPGTVTSLVPTGVTALEAPVEVDTAASTLALSASTINVNPQAVCNGNPIEDPESVTAAATVVDTTGAPVVGATVIFGIESPLMIDNATHVTDANGVATAVITLPYEDAVPLTTYVTAHVDFGSGADLASAQLTIAPVYTVSPAPPTMSVVPTADSPVFANGVDSYTASISFKDHCGSAQPSVDVEFSVSGSAQLSQTSVTTDEQGNVSVTLTDEAAEMVTVSATTPTSPFAQIAPVTVTFTTVPQPSPSPSLTPAPTPSGSPSPSPTQSVTTPPPSGSPSPSPTQLVTTPPPSQTPPPIESTSTPPSPSQSPTQSISASPSQPVTTPPPSQTPPPSGSPSPSQSTPPLPSESPLTPSESPTQLVTTPPPSQTPPPAPVGGTLRLDPAELSGAGSTAAIATVVDSQGRPVPDIPVTFQIGGNAQFVGGSTILTDSLGQATALISTTTLDCSNPGFDVYATFTVSTTVQLSGSPARATIDPPAGACDVAAYPPEVKLANATIIAGNATPLASVTVVSAAGTLLGTSTVDMTGYWSIPTLAGIPSQQITVSEISSTGQSAATSAWLDTDLPAPARIDQADTHEVAGTLGAVESSATLTVIFPDGTMIRALANADGSYAVATPDQMTLGVVTVIVTDTAGNPSDPATANLVTYVVPPTPPSTVTVSVKYPQVEVGGKQTVTGYGFRYFERVTAQFCTTTCTTVGTGYATLNGQVNITFTVPSTTALGTYTVTLTGPTSGSASATFDVIAPAIPAVTQCCAYLLWWAKWLWLFF